MELHSILNRQTHYKLRYENDNDILYSNLKSCFNEGINFDIKIL